ncbi:hypothetical protein DW036_16090 [Bacteroides sp. AF39-11AC]|jgi:hypothetical protein|nr:hypothetical protein DW036_16090 [Bacteroides sp. AF39-11AC]
MRPLDVSLYLFVLNCNECFRKVVDMWREMNKRNYLTLCISAFKSKLLKISRLIPPDAYSTGLSYIPNCGCKSSALFLNSKHFYLFLCHYNLTE